VAPFETVQRALEPLWPAFHDAVDTGDFTRLSDGQQAVAFAWVLSGLADNGGFSAWIESMGHRSPEAVRALEFLGAAEYVPLLWTALDLYPTFAGDDPMERLSASEQWTGDDEARLDALEAAFGDLQAQRDLVEHYAAAYVTAHPEEFAR